LITWTRLAVLIGIAAALVVASVALGSHTHSMFKTANYSGDCHDNAWSTSHFCRTDNQALSIYRESGFSSGGRSNIGSTLTQSYTTTDLNVDFPGSASYSGGAETDIIYQYKPSSVPSGYDGWTWCNDAVGALSCDQHYAAFQSASPTWPLACHETGHAVGLTHGQDASPRVSNGDNGLACLTTPVETHLLGSHNTGQINGAY